MRFVCVIRVPLCARVSRVCPVCKKSHRHKGTFTFTPHGRSRLPTVSFYRNRVSGVVCGDACVPGFGCGLARESVGGVGFEVGL